MEGVGAAGTTPTGACGCVHDSACVLEGVRPDEKIELTVHATVANALAPSMPTTNSPTPMPTLRALPGVVGGCEGNGAGVGAGPMIRSVPQNAQRTTPLV